MKIVITTQNQPGIVEFYSDTDNLEVKWSSKDSSYVVLQNGQFLGCVPQNQTVYIAVYDKYTEIPNV